MIGAAAVAQKGENGGAVSKTSVNKHRRRESRCHEKSSLLRTPSDPIA